MASPHPHRRRCHILDPSQGFIILPRVEHHDPRPGEIGGHCGMCGTLVWVDAETTTVLMTHPGCGQVCCHCGMATLAALRRALPDLPVNIRRVADLARAACN